MLKRILTVVLLAFVFACVIVLILPRGETVPWPADGIPAASQPQTDGIAVYYLHGAKNCPECATIAHFAQAALAAMPPSGRPRFTPIDTAREPRYAAAFAMTVNTLVLVEERAGVVVRWRRLDEVWRWIEDETSFGRNLAATITAFAPGNR